MLPGDIGRWCVDTRVTIATRLCLGLSGRTIWNGHSFTPASGREVIEWVDVCFSC